MKFNRSLLIALGSALLLAGCSKKEAAGRLAQAQARLNPPAAPGPWSWEKFPSSDRMRLGHLTCQLLPKSMITTVSPLLGTLRVYVTAPQTNLSAGTLWAEFEPEIFAAEKRQLEDSKIKLAEREKIQFEIELPRQRLQLQRAIEEFERQVALVRLLATNKELANLTLSVGAGGSALRPDSLSKSEVELSLMRQNLAFLNTTNSVLAGGELASQRADLDRRLIEFERRQAQSRFSMPFDGRLTLTLPLTEGVTEYPVTTGQELAVARDLSRVRLRVPMPNASWTSLPAEQLYALIRLPSGTEMTAPFSYQKIERVQGTREEAVYYFEFTPEQSQLAARLVGTDNTCELWARFPQQLRIVPKMDLVLHNPAALEGRNWGQGVGAMFAGAQVAIEGQAELGIIVPGTTTTAN